MVGRLDCCKSILVYRGAGIFDATWVVTCQVWSFWRFIEDRPLNAAAKGCSRVLLCFLEALDLLGLMGFLIALV